MRKNKVKHLTNSTIFDAIVGAENVLNSNNEALKVLQEQIELNPRKPSKRGNKLNLTEFLHVKSLSKATKRHLNEALSWRAELISRFQGLAVNQAQGFRKRSKSKLPIEELVQEAYLGMIIAMDRYQGPYDERKFINKLIFGMKRQMLAANSSTLISMSDKDRRLLYRTRKALKDPKKALFEDTFNYFVDYFENL